MKRKTFVNTDLIVRIGNGDDCAFTELYNLTYKQVFSFLIAHTLNYQDAEDLLQETYFNIKKGAKKFDSEKSPMTWIFTIAKNLYVSSKRKIKIYADDIGEYEDQCSNLGNQALDSENKIIIDYCLSMLSETERRIVIMRAVCGMKHKEIAEMLNIPVATVKTKYNRSLKTLYEKMRKEDCL